MKGLNRTRFTTLIATLGMVAACSSMKVTTDYSEATDFKQFSTFKYVNSDQNLSGTYNLHHQRVVKALTQEMVSEGFTEVTTTAIRRGCDYS